MMFRLDQLTFRTALSPRECERRLASALRERALGGNVWVGGFEVSSACPFRSMFQPIAVGRVHGAAGGTHLEVSVAAARPGAVAWALWAGALVLGVLLLGFGVAAHGSPATWSIGPTYVALVLGILILGYGLGAIPFGLWQARREAPDLVAALARTLAAEELAAGVPAAFTL